MSAYTYMPEYVVVFQCDYVSKDMFIFVSICIYMCVCPYV